MNYIQLDSLHVDDFNNSAWKDKCPKSGDIVHTRFNARIVPYTIFGDRWDDFDDVELIFVARINVGGTFTAYWATAGEAELGAIHYADSILGYNDLDELEYVTFRGRKITNLFAASTIFYYLSATYGLKAII